MGCVIVVAGYSTVLMVLITLGNMPSPEFLSDFRPTSGTQQPTVPTSRYYVWYSCTSQVSLYCAVCSYEYCAHHACIGGSIQNV